MENKERQLSGTSSYLREMYQLLYERLGPQNWWPGETPFEVMVGAVLTQNTNWSNVEKAIRNLKSSGKFSVKALLEMPEGTLAALVRPAGYYNIKTKRLRNLLEMIMRDYGGSLERFLAEDMAKMREKLLAVKGIGPETADSIILYAAQKPIFVVDAYTYRILSRHDMIGDGASYEEIQELFMSHLPEDTKLFNEFHALIVRAAKNYCRKRPLCKECPLEAWGPAKYSLQTTQP